MAELQTSTNSRSTGTEQISPYARILSLDVFRGLTMVVMIFVNDLASVKGLPWWTYHMPGKPNGMTYVDMVFPAFLFIVGMSIPLAVRQRLAKSSFASLWLHIIARALGLIVLGIALANADDGDSKLMPVSTRTWSLLMLLGAFLFWNIYPKNSPRQTLFRSLKFVGLVLIVTMFAIFRRTAKDGHVAWLNFSYWEILGIIGWTYFTVCLLYIPTRRWKWAPFFWLVVLAVLNVCSTAGWAPFTHHLPFYLWPFKTGAMELVTMAGVATSAIFLNYNIASTFDRKSRWAGVLAALLLGAAYLLTPLGISKIRATPTWCLYSAGASVLLFLLLYWICDVKKRTAWASFVKPAGSNTLLTYLLPDLFYFAVGTSYLSATWQHGGSGIAKSVVFTGSMLVLSALLTKWKLRLQL